MAKQYDVRVTITEVQKGKCSQGFKPGDTWLIEKGQTPAGMCSSVYSVLYPFILTMRYGGEAPYAEDKEVLKMSCPDYDHVVVYELRRIPKG